MAPRARRRARRPTLPRAIASSPATPRRPSVDAAPSAGRSPGSGLWRMARRPSGAAARLRRRADRRRLPCARAASRRRGARRWRARITRRRNRTERRPVAGRRSERPAALVRRSDVEVGSRLATTRGGGSAPRPRRRATAGGANRRTRNGRTPRVADAKEAFRADSRRRRHAAAPEAAQARAARRESATPEADARMVLDDGGQGRARGARGDRETDARRRRRSVRPSDDTRATT